MNKFTKIQRCVSAPRGSSVERIGVLAGITLLFALMSCPGFGETETRREVLRSPDGRLVLRVETQPVLSLSVERDGQIAIPSSPAGIVLERSGALPGTLHCVGVKKAVINESFAVPVGKRSHVQNRANELTLDFGEETGYVKFSLIFRAYDEGVAYRYRIHGSGEDTTVSELSGFRIPVASTAWFAKYVNSYESIYKLRPAWAAFADDIQVPALFRTPGRQWIYLTEADVDGSYAGARLHIIDPATGLLGYKPEGHPHSTMPWETPWRVAMVATDLKALVESSLIVALANRRQLPIQAGSSPGPTFFPGLQVR